MLAGSSSGRSNRDDGPLDDGGYMASAAEEDASRKEHGRCPAARMTTRASTDSDGAVRDSG